MSSRRVYVPVQVGVRLPPRLKAWLEQRADAEDMSVSTLVREWIQEHARRDLQQRHEVGDGDLSV
jgi:NADH:ubiquinone oxidoreductase subunit